MVCCLDLTVWSQQRAGRKKRYLIFNVFIVLEKLLKDHRGVPGVILVVDAATGQLRLPVPGHSHGVPVAEGRGLTTHILTQKGGCKAPTVTRLWCSGAQHQPSALHSGH